jgi:sodium/bile acid cotransporter 7
MARSNFFPDSFTVALVATVALASLLPASGMARHFFEILTTIAIGLLFFLHGAKLSREAVLAGITHWRLHLLVFGCTFALFPLLGLALKPVLTPLVTPELYTIAFTSMARGNIPAAVCSASASTLLGVFITPILVDLIVVPSGGAAASFGAIGRILLQLMLPFIVGHLMRPWIGGWIARRAAVLKFVDQGSILLVVYTAFSAAVIEGLWKQVPVSALLGLVLVCGVILTLALISTTWLARRLGFDKEDEITIVFCGSKKSLASGIPMAQVLFASHAVGAIVLPLMLFHQIQLMVCAVLAQRYARRLTSRSATPSAQLKPAD